MLTLHPDDAVDLQMHTTYSDGIWTPETLMPHLAERGFRAVAVTDHDCFDGISHVVAAGRAVGVHVIPAVEMTTMWGEYKADLLCFAASFSAPALAAMAAATERAQLENTRQVHAELLSRGYRFPRQPEVLSLRAGHVVRPIDNVTLLRAHGYSHSFDDAVALVAHAGMRTITVALADAVAAAHASGAVALIAHPGRGEPPFTRYDTALLTALCDDVPLDGIEVYYPLHTPRQVAEFARFAHAHGLLQSAGSDSHGPDGRLPIAYRASQVHALLHRCGIAVSGTPAE